MKLRIDSKYIPVLASAAVLVLLYVGGCIIFADQNFATLSVITDLFRDENAVLKPLRKVDISAYDVPGHPEKKAVREVGPTSSMFGSTEVYILLA